LGNSWKRLDKTTTIREMLPEEAGYVGALVDGEGSIYCRPTGTGTLQVSNTEIELISALLRATGAGTVTAYWPSGGGYAPKKKYQLQFVWSLARLPDLEKVLIQIAPFSLKAQKLLIFISPKIAEWRQRKQERTTCSDCKEEVSYQGHPHRCGRCAARVRQEEVS